MFCFADGSDVWEKFLLVILPSDNFHCGRCHHYTADKDDHVCSRYEEVLADGWDT